MKEINMSKHLFYVIIHISHAHKRLYYQFHCYICQRQLTHIHVVVRFLCTYVLTSCAKRCDIAKGNSNLWMFHCDNMCKPVMTAHSAKEMGKIRILQTTESFQTVGHSYLYHKRKENERYQLEPEEFHVFTRVRSDSILPTSNHKSGSQSQRSLGLTTPVSLYSWIIG